MGIGLETNIQHPSFTRPNRTISITILFANAGNVDIPIPVRFLVSLEGAPIGLSVADLDLGIEELKLEFKEINGPEHVLRPGANGSVTIYTKAIRPLSFKLLD